MKTRLKSGEDKILNTREKAARQTFPQGVIDIAAKHWDESIEESEKLLKMEMKLCQYVTRQ